MSTANKSKKEKDIIKTVAESLPKMDERSKGYFLGYAEAMAAQKREKDEKATCTGNDS